MSAIAKTHFLAPVANADPDGYSVRTELCGRSPAVLIVLSGQHDRGDLILALDIGRLQLAFAAGGEHSHPETLAHAKPSARRPDEARLANGGTRASPSDLGLTERQLDVLALVMQGKSNKAICRVLDLAEPTVKNHVTAILRALEVSNRTQAVIAVAELGCKLPPVSKSLAALGLSGQVERSESNGNHARRVPFARARTSLTKAVQEPS
jgi:DNA-binding NarL/FixJ family response regulator